MHGIMLPCTNDPKNAEERDLGNARGRHRELSTTRGWVADHIKIIIALRIVTEEPRLTSLA